MITQCHTNLIASNDSLSMNVKSCLGNGKHFIFLIFITFVRLLSILHPSFAHIGNSERRIQLPARYRTSPTQIDKKFKNLSMESNTSNYPYPQISPLQSLFFLPLITPFNTYSVISVSAARVVSYHTTSHQNNRQSPRC